MALDFNRLRSKLEQLQNPKKWKENNGNPYIWKPKKDGSISTVRLVEYPYGQDPFVELWFHYNIGKGQGFLCPKWNHGKSCPVCDFAANLRESKSEEDLKLAKTLYATQRTHAIVIDREDATNTPKYWGFGKEVYQTLIQYLLNKDYGNYMDVENGLDLDVNLKNAEGGPGQPSFPKTVIQFKRKESALVATPQDRQKILSSVKKVEEVYLILSKAQIQERLNSWLSFTEEDAEEVSKEVVKGGNGATTTTTAKPATNGKTNGKKAAPAPVEEEATTDEDLEDIDAAFEEALNG